MADISQKLQFVIEQVGEEKVAAALEDLTQKKRKLSAETDKLSGFIRAQRTENRQQTFLFRESKDAIMSTALAANSLSNSFVSNTGQLKLLNGVLGQSFQAFQGADFAMAAMGVSTGGLSIAIAGILAVGAGLITFLNDSGQSAEAAKKQLEGYRSAMKDMVEGLDLKYSTEEMKRVVARQDHLEKSLEQAKRQREILQSELSGAPGKLEEAKRLDQDIAAWQKQVDLGKELADVYRNLIYQIEQKNAVKLREAVIEKGVTQAIYRGFSGDRLGIASAADAMEYYRKNDKRINPFIDNMSMKSVGGIVPVPETLGKSLDELNQKELQFINELQGGFSVLIQGVDALGIKTDSLLSKIIRAVQEAAKIAEYLALMDAGKMSGAGGILGIVGSALGIGGLLLSTGPGTRKAYADVRDETERLGY